MFDKAIELCLFTKTKNKKNVTKAHQQIVINMNQVHGDF